MITHTKSAGTTAGPSRNMNRTDEVLQLHDAGMGLYAISERTGVRSSTVHDLIARYRPSRVAATHRNSAERLLAEIQAESAARVARRSIAATQGATAVPSVGGTVLAAPARGADARPAAVSRDSCSRCGTRGDLGCRHQRPYIQGETD